MALVESMMVEIVAGEVPEEAEAVGYLVARFGNNFRACRDSYFPIT